MTDLDTFALATLNALSANIALVNAEGEILAVNNSWRGFAEANAARSNVMEGANYLAVCKKVSGRDAQYAESFSTGLEAVLSGKRNEFALEYPCHSPTERRWFVGRVSRFLVGDKTYAVIAHENITERKLAEAERHNYIKEAAFKQERQRITRELHDGVNQAIFSSMSISRAIPRIMEREPTRALSLIEDLTHLNQCALSEMRMLLNEVRPEAIINTALSTLLRHLADVVTNRLDIEATVSINGTEINLPPDIHLGIYRIAQEAINNILKHSQAQLVDISVTYAADQLTVVIKDNGRGFDPQTVKENIGLTNMRERAAEINASLEIVSTPHQGTEVKIHWIAFDS